MEVLIQEKLDGISLALTYVDGSLVTAVTRGDGTVGQDITPNARFVAGIPESIGEKETVVIRGEAVIPWLEFRQYHQNKANPRNACAGLMTGRSSPEDLKTVRFIAYDYYGVNRNAFVLTEMQAVDHLRRLGFWTPELNWVTGSVQQACDYYQTYDTGLRESLPYVTDGLVVKLNSFAEQNRMDVKDNRPEWAVAVKPSPRVCLTRVVGVTWSMGLSGRYAPVAQVEPTELDGTTLRNVSMHNLDYLYEWYQKGFRVGAQVQVHKAGEIIPQLVSVLSEGMNVGSN